MYTLHFKNTRSSNKLSDVFAVHQQSTLKEDALDWCVRLLLRAGVQPTLDHSAETFMSVQCASPGKGGELVGVCGVCASCVGWRKG